MCVTYVLLCMCVYALITEVKRVYDVYQYIFPHRESMSCVSIIYSLSTPPHSELSAEECHPDSISEGIGYTSNKGLSWQGLGEDVSHVEACRHMMYLDVSFLQVILEPFYLEIHMFGS